MTLILAASVGGEFAVMTGDTITAYRDVTFEIDKAGKSAVIEESEVHRITKDAKKVNWITPYVMWGAGGNSEIIRDLLSALKKRVRYDDAILDCAVILDEIIQEKRQSKEKPDFYHYLDEEDGFGIIMSGFHLNGQSAFAYYMSGIDKEVLVEEVPDGKYVYKMISPSSDYTNNMKEFLEIPKKPEITTGEDVINHFVKIHSVLARLEPNAISEICDYRITVWDKILHKPNSASNSINITPLMELQDVQEAYDLQFEGSDQEDE